jgi:Tol biopolymer transport system component
VVDDASRRGLFVETVPRSWGKVWLYYGDRASGRKITQTANTFSLPKLAPTQDRFYCYNHRGHIIVIDTSDTELANLGRADYPQWSPDGDFIAFCRTEYSHYDIEASDLWIARYDGTEMRQLTDTPDVIETGGVFSPDGRYLAYTNGRTREIYVIELN